MIGVEILRGGLGLFGIKRDQIKTKMETGLKDCNGQMINDGDWVSLDGNMTADDSMGSLPNGWIFDEDDVYQVYFDENIKNWSLRIGLEPDTPLNVKYMNHAVGLLHQESVEIIKDYSEKISS